METIKNNILIAEFMGAKRDKDVNFHLYEDELWIPNICKIKIEYMRYHSSWDWLMPVIAKIWAMDSYRHFVDETSGQFENKIEIDANINHTYPTVAEFIKWYNKN